MFWKLVIKSTPAVTNLLNPKVHSVEIKLPTNKIRRKFEMAVNRAVKTCKTSLIDPVFILIPFNYVYVREMQMKRFRRRLCLRSSYT